MDTIEVNVNAYSKETHNLITTKVMTLKEWMNFKKFGKSYYYRAFQK